MSADLRQTDFSGGTVMKLPSLGIRRISQAFLKSGTMNNRFLGNAVNWWTQIIMFLSVCYGALVLIYALALFISPGVSLGQIAMLIVVKCVMGGIYFLLSWLVMISFLSMFRKTAQEDPDTAGSPIGGRIFPTLEHQRQLRRQFIANRRWTVFGVLFMAVRLCFFHLGSWFISAEKLRRC